MKNVIIVVHGLGNKPPADLLSDWLKRSINEGMERLGHPVPEYCFDLCYWADIIYDQPLDQQLTDPENKLFIEEPYTPAAPQAEPAQEPLKQKLWHFIEKNLDTVFLNDDLTLNFSAISDAVIHRYFEDLEAYYAQPRIRMEVRKRLAALLEKYANDRIMLIAHSMGSIIAYDVLTLITPEIPIDTFVTIGSPLGLPVIVHRIMAEQPVVTINKKIAAPENITTAWLNFSDPDDKVALDHSLSDDFAANSKGIFVQDQLVFNDYISNGERNPHKSFGYLRTRQMASAISSFLSVTPTRKKIAWTRRVALLLKRVFVGRNPNYN